MGWMTQIDFQIRTMQRDRGSKKSENKHYQIQTIVFPVSHCHDTTLIVWYFFLLFICPSFGRRVLLLRWHCQPSWGITFSGWMSSIFFLSSWHSFCIWYQHWGLIICWGIELHPQGIRQWINTRTLGRQTPLTWWGHLRSCPWGAPAPDWPKFYRFQVVL